MLEPRRIQWGDAPDLPEDDDDDSYSGSDPNSTSDSQGSDVELDDGDHEMLDAARDTELNQGIQYITISDDDEMVIDVHGNPAFSPVEDPVANPVVDPVVDPAGDPANDPVGDPAHGRRDDRGGPSYGVEDDEDDDADSVVLIDDPEPDARLALLTGRKGKGPGDWASSLQLLPEVVSAEDAARGLVIPDVLRHFDRNHDNVMLDSIVVPRKRHCGCKGDTQYLTRPRLINTDTILWAPGADHIIRPIGALFTNLFTPEELGPLERVYRKSDFLPYTQHRINDSAPRYRNTQPPPLGVSRGNHGGIWMIRGAQIPYPQPIHYTRSGGESGTYLSNFEINAAYHRTGIQSKVEAALYLLSRDQYRTGRDLVDTLHSSMAAFLPPRSAFTTSTTAFNSIVDCHGDPQDWGLVAQLVWGNFTDGGHVQFLDHNIEVEQKTGHLLIFMAAGLHHAGTPYTAGVRRLLSWHIQAPVVQAFQTGRPLWNLLRDDWAQDPLDWASMACDYNHAIGQRRSRSATSDNKVTDQDILRELDHPAVLEDHARPGHSLKL